MKIVSLNAWGGKLGAPLIDYLRVVDADVLCLQEVVHTPATTKEWLTYRNGDHVLAQRTNLFAELAAALPGYVATFCPAAQGELWDGELAVPSQFGIATFVRANLRGIFSFLKWKGKPMDNDASFRLDFSVRDDITSNSRLDQANSLPTAGQKVIFINPSIDYVISNRVNIKLYFEQRRVEPKISTAPPITNTRGGVQIRVSLAQ